MVISLLALHVSCQSGSSPVSDSSSLSPHVKSIPYSGHLLYFSLPFFSSALFLGEKSELARGFPNAGPSWMRVLTFSVLFWFL